MKRRIQVPEAHRPGLSLSGYLKGHAGKRILIFGKVEIEYLRDLDPNVRIERLHGHLIPYRLLPSLSLGAIDPQKSSSSYVKSIRNSTFPCHMSTMNL